MGEQQTEPRWFRVAFGRPRLWNGVAWLVIAACWFGVTVGGGGGPWGYLLAALWAILGGVMVSIAARDVRQGRGAYARAVDGRHSETSAEEVAGRAGDG